MKPGTRVRFKVGCAWPERIGAEGVIVDPAIFGGFYPADHRMKAKFGKTDVIVRLDSDPLDPTSYGDPRWSCVTSVSSLEVVADAKAPGHEES